MSSLPYEAKVLDQFHVSPPPNAVPQTALPLTFFDTFWLLMPDPVQRIFFYEYPVSVSDFWRDILPDLIRSLSFSLQYFFPLAGNLVSPSQPSATTKSYILYEVGDYVTLTVVESNGNFNEVQADSAKDVRVLHLLVPDFPQPRVPSDDDSSVKRYPLLALKITIFPNSGICIGISTRHIAADGKSSLHFLKSWASIFKSNGDVSCLQSSPPLHERDSIKDGIGLKEKYLDIYWNNKWKWDDPSPADDIFDGMVKATFVVKRCLVDKLKKCILDQCKNNSDQESQHLSTFVATCSFLWICLVKSRREVRGNSISFDEEVDSCPFMFVADCRNRYGSGVPERYFGNCLAGCLAHCKLKDIVGETGLLMAAKSIAFGIKQVENNGNAELLAPENFERYQNPYFLSLAGSPKLKIYDLDFGWGKPKKCEVVHIDRHKAISLAECRDEEGGLEVGVALQKDEMVAFTSFFETGCKDLL